MNMVQTDHVAVMLLAAVVNMVALASPLAAQGTQVRSVTDVRPRLTDELARPFYRHTQSHRGWEVREPQFTVFAGTSDADARWAAEQVAAAWNEAARLADRWTAVHRHPDFGLSSLQVVIDAEPVRERDAPLTTLSVVGIQTQISLNVAPGQPPLAEQSVRLREAAAFAMLHAAGLDDAAPPWVVDGLAAYAGRRGLSEQEATSGAKATAAIPLGGDAWRQTRAMSDRLNGTPFDRSESRARIAFLLEGDDAAHAPLLFAALREATEAAARSAALDRGGARPTFANAASGGDAPFDRLIASLQDQYEAWQREPLAGQPVFEPADGDSPEQIAQQREMIVLLKLIRRHGAAPPGSPRTKVVGWDRDQGRTVPPAAAGMRPITMSQLAARLTDPHQPPWATIDADGSILLSTDTDRLRDLLGLADRRNRLEHDGQRLTLIRQFDSGPALRAWLEDNPHNPQRPLARFSRD